MSELAAPRTMPHSVAETSAEQTRRGQLSERVFGIWSFIMIECLVFSAYFVLYLLHRMHDPRSFATAQAQLTPAFGCFHTLVLLTSSWQAALSLHSGRSAKYEVASRRAIYTIALGLLFIASKLTEWINEIGRGHSFGTSEFFSFYFFLTGIHVVHVLIGIAFMTSTIVNLRSATPSRESIEISATYWHMVDFLWVMIFALLYVVK